MVWERKYYPFNSFPPKSKVVTGFGQSRRERVKEKRWAVYTITKRLVWDNLDQGSVVQKAISLIQD